jgi:hypothetical protein
MMTQGEATTARQLRQPNVGQSAQAATVGHRSMVSQI